MNFWQAVFGPPPTFGLVAIENVIAAVRRAGEEPHRGTLAAIMATLPHAGVPVTALEQAKSERVHQMQESSSLHNEELKDVRETRDRVLGLERSIKAAQDGLSARSDVRTRDKARVQARAEELLGIETLLGPKLAAVTT